jgi:hypothetical protein
MGSSVTGLRRPGPQPLADLLRFLSEFLMAGRKFDDQNVGVA